MISYMQTVAAVVVRNSVRFKFITLMVLFNYMFCSEVCFIISHF